MWKARWVILRQKECLSKLSWYYASSRPTKSCYIYFKNIFNPNPSVNKIATEYEIVNGEEILLEYKEINIIQHKDSIYWGIRWLYHKAQVNNNTNGIWCVVGELGDKR